MFQKVADILGKLNGMVLLAAALGIVAAVFIVGLIVSLGGELHAFKAAAKKTIKEPTLAVANKCAKELPVRARKQYKALKQAGGKPDDFLTVDTCVHAPFAASAAAHFPGAVMAAGIFAVLLSFFAVGYVKPDKLIVIGEESIANYGMVIPALVTVGAMIFRLAAGLISSAILRGGVKTYEKYTAALGKALGGAHESTEQRAEPTTTDIPFADDTVHTAAFGDTFDAPDHISVELADEPETYTTTEPVQEEIVMEPVTSDSIVQEPIMQEPILEDPVVQEPIMREPVQEPVMQDTVVTSAPHESEQEQRARARAEAMARMREEQMAAQQQAAQQQTAAQQQAQQAAAQQTAQPEQSAADGSSADAVIARIDAITREGASLATMKEVALQLQKERAKPENKTPERQRKLNEALAALLKAMSSATRK